MEMNECEFDFVLNDHFLLSVEQTDRPREQEEKDYGAQMMNYFRNKN
jgi:hypothetical protein